MRIKLFLFYILIFSTNFSYAQTKEGFKDSIRTLLAEQKLSGAVWVTVADNGETITDAICYKITRTKELLSPTTDKIHVGSVAKTIIAVRFLQNGKS